MRDLPLFGRGAAVPLAKMETVVQAVLTCIEDESLKGMKNNSSRSYHRKVLIKNSNTIAFYLLLLGETLLALPGDIVRVHPRPEQIGKLD